MYRRANVVAEEVRKDGQRAEKPPSTASNGEVVIAGIPGEEATVKTYTAKGKTVTLLQANDDLEPMVYDAGEVKVFGKVVTVLRRY